jgi:outer membrane lipoprotein
VISNEVRRESESDVPFKTLLHNSAEYIGKSVILGGYILSTTNLSEETHLTVLQAPLVFRDEPKSKDYSEGRFIVVHKHFLDPEIYSKHRKITVAGKIVEYNKQKVDDYPNPYLKIESREIYLWPESEQEYISPYYDYGYYPFPYPLHRYRYYPHGW